MNFKTENNKKKTKRIIIIIIIFLLLFLVINELTSNKESANENSNNNIISKDNNVFILDNYPINEVPLKDLVMIQSMKYYVNYDSNSFFGYLRNKEEGINYYNVVFYNSSNPQDFVDYYASLMSEVSDEYTTDSQVYGKIGDYKVSAAHRGGDVAYVQVFLPNFEYENPYLDDFPSDLVKINDYLVEKENSYGHLNQNGGEIEYTKYFNLKAEYKEELDDINERYASLFEEYREKYKNEDNFVVNDEDMSLKWSKDDYNITLSFVPSHGRVYLMIRKLM
jgi:hypothetical protein